MRWNECKFFSLFLATEIVVAAVLILGRSVPVFLFIYWCQGIGLAIDSCKFVMREGWSGGTPSGVGGAPGGEGLGPQDAMQNEETPEKSNTKQEKAGEGWLNWVGPEPIGFLPKGRWLSSFSIVGQTSSLLHARGMMRFSEWRCGIKMRNKCWCLCQKLLLFTVIAREKDS